MAFPAAAAAPAMRTCTRNVVETLTVLQTAMVPTTADLPAGTV